MRALAGWSVGEAISRFRNLGRGLVIAFLGLFCIAHASAGRASPLVVYDLRCETAVDPLGVDRTVPELSWKLRTNKAGDRKQVQTAYRIVVASKYELAEAGTGDLWDSGKVSSSRSLNVPYDGARLTSHQRCYWRVRVWDKDGLASNFGREARWSMGLLPGGTWKANWITVPGERCPMLRRGFTVQKPVQRAWIYVSSLGLYQAALNGEKIGNARLTPGWTDYRRLVTYQTYDLTNQLQVGPQVLTAQLAPGWYAGKVAWLGPNRYGANPAFFAELHVRYTDDTEDVIGTGPDWQAATGPILDADLQDGEDYDAAQLRPGWAKPNYKGKDLIGVKTIQLPPAVSFASEPCNPIKEVGTTAAIARKETEPGVYVYRFPRAITGTVRVRVKGAAGETVTLRYGQVVDENGSLESEPRPDSQAPITTRLSADHYHFAQGGFQVISPAFTLHRFQYIEISGVSAPPPLNEVDAVALGTELSPSGTVETSDPGLNQLLAQASTIGRNSFVSVPLDGTDAPTMLGATGPASFYARSAMYSWDMDRLYRKWAADIVLAQNADGCFSSIAPSAGPGTESGFGGGWGDAGVELPYAVWRHYGDLRIVRESFPAIARWIEYVKARSEGFIASARFAPMGDPFHVDAETPAELIATAYYAHDVTLAIEMAEALGRHADAERWRWLEASVKGAFAKRFVGSDGRVGSGSQTAQVLGLRFGLVPKDRVATAGQILVSNILGHGNTVTTGWVGAQYLLEVLSEVGRSDVAYALALGRQLNPPAPRVGFASYGAWFFERVAGVSVAPDASVANQFLIAPAITSELKRVHAEWETEYGPIVLTWERSGSRTVLWVNVPPNTSAKVILPTKNGGKVTESGHAVSSVSSAHLYSKEPNWVVVVIGSGEYRFAFSD